MFPFFMGCSEDLYFDEPQDFYGELPIEFEFVLPAFPATRGIDGDCKTSFTGGDVIHIFGTFKTRELQESGDYIDGELSRYGALKYNGSTRKWEALEGSKLTWPSVAVEGTFKAYYVSNSNGLLTDATETEIFFLSDVTPLSDPLKAESESYIGYGHAVRLNFNHICAYLTLIDLEPQVSNYYWFKRDGVDNFNNAFKLVLKKDANGNPQSLDVEFCRVASDENFEDLIYIAADAIAITDDNGKKIAKANYFLEPGYYDTFSLCYPAGTTIYDYLKYDYSKIPDNSGGENVENNVPHLEGGTAYTLTITKSPGVTINSPSSGEGWHDGPPYYKVDVEAFLKAIYNKTDYIYKYKDENSEDEEVTILEATADGVKLLCNVDFDNFKYSNFKDKTFVPNILEGVVFDGDYHYIINLASSLFRYNYGTIKNVGINDIDIETTSYEDEDYENHDKDMSRHGALCMWNRTNAIINNVRVTNVNMKVFVRSEIEAGVDGSETHNIGCVIGSNTGKVNEVALAGNFTLTVTGEEGGKPVNSSVLIGGVVGQNAAEGNIYDVSPLGSDLKIEIINTCKGYIGSYSVGGVVGESTGNITGVILSDVTIDGTQSKGVTSYIGGVAGQLAVSESSASMASVSSCVVSGSIKAGITVPYGSITSGSYIGGIIGADLDVPVLDCRAAVSVYNYTPANEGVIYATGGVFGRIRSENTLAENIIAYGSALSGPNAVEKNQYVGNFAGIVYKGKIWEDYARHNILIRTFGNYEPIGGALDSNNNK